MCINKQLFSKVEILEYVLSLLFVVIILFLYQFLMI